MLHQFSSHYFYYKIKNFITYLFPMLIYFNIKLMLYIVYCSIYFFKVGNSDLLDYLNYKLHFFDD